MRAVTTAVVLSSLLAATTAEGAWVQIRSAHYLFLSDAGRGDTQRIAQRLEQFHSAMQQLLSRAALSTSAPTVVFVFKDRRSLQSFLPLDEGKPVNAAGYASSGADFNYIAMDASAQGDQAFAIAFRSLTHVFVSNIWRNPPHWYSQGAAEYYSTFDLRSPTEVRVGTPIARHVELLRQRRLPIAELLAIADITPLLDDRKAEVFYAQSWALFHLLSTRDGGGQRLANYVALTDQGLSAEQALTQAFATDVATLEKELDRYVRQFSMMAIGAKLATAVSVPPSVATDVSENAVAPRLADLQLRVGRGEEAEARARLAVTQTPQSAAAHALLATIRLQKGDASAAGELPQKPLVYQDFLDHYTVALVLDRLLRTPEQRPEATPAQRAFREHALAAADAQTGVAEAWRLAARAHLMADETAPAGVAIERALEIAPANEAYRFILAEVLVRKGEFARSRDILALLLARGRTQAVREEARRMMGLVVKYERAVQDAKAGAPPARAGPPGAADAAPANAATSRTIPTFRTVAADETRVWGKLSAIECRAGGVSLVLDLAGRQLRVATKAFDQIQFITYREDLKGQVTCGPRTTPDDVYVTWRGAAADKADVVTSSIAVEFTPVGYRP